MGWIFFLVLLFLLLAGVIIGVLHKDKKTQKNNRDTAVDSSIGWWFLNDSDTSDHSGSSDSGGDGGGD